MSHRVGLARQQRLADALAVDVAPLAAARGRARWLVTGQVDDNSQLPGGDCCWMRGRDDTVTPSQVTPDNDVCKNPYRQRSPKRK